MTIKAIENFFERLFHKHHPAAVRYAKDKYKLAWDTADQITTDAFIVMRNEMYAGVSIQHINAWLRRAIHARYVDWLRKKTRQQRGGQWRQTGYGTALAVEHDDFNAVDCADMLQAAMQRLNRNEQKILDCLVQGDDIQSIADKFNVTRRTMERYVSALRRKLQDLHCFT